MASGLENIETIESPFRRFVTTIGVFPTAFTDAMTYYECLAYLVKYLEDSVVPAVNENAEALKELQDYVVHYFDNLDVQDEINNKLDQMAEDGTLQEIIGSYLQANVAWTFDTVADMKASTNLVDGSFAQTLGFHTINDGGGALYHITDSGSADEKGVIAVGDLYATIVTGKIGTPEQYGAYGDNTHDDAASINACIAGNDVINFYPKTYLISIDPANAYAIDLPSNKTINGNEGTLVLTPNALDVYQIIKISSKTNVTIRGLNIIGDIDNHEGTGELCEGIKVISSENITIDNCTISKTQGDNIRLTGYETPNNNVTVENCDFKDGGRNGLSIEDVTNTIIKGCHFGSFNTKAPKLCIDVEPFDATQTIKNLVITECICENTSNEDVEVHLTSTTTGCDVTLTNIKCKNRVIFANNGTYNVVNADVIYADRISLCQNDPNSHYKITGIYLDSRLLTGLGYRDSSIFIDLTASGDVVSYAQTGLYNVELEGTIVGNGNYSPFWLIGNDATKKYIGTNFTLMIPNNNFQQVGSGLNTLTNNIEWVTLKPSVYVPTEAKYDLSMFQTVFWDKNNLNGGTRYIDRMIKNNKITIIAGTSAINPVISSNRTYSFSYLDGLDNKNVPAGEQRSYTRIGDTIYVSLI